MTPFEAYKLYLALKMHFKQKGYDFIQYNGKVRANKDSFEGRHDKYMFNKLARRDDPKGFLIANFVKHGPDTWIGTLLDDDIFERTYQRWMKFNQSLSYNFTQELELLDDDLDGMMKTTGDYPKLLYKYMDGEISIETMVVINGIIRFLPYWNKNIKDTVVWPEYSLVIEKYTPFVRYDRDKMKKIMKERWQHEDQYN